MTSKSATNVIILQVQKSKGGSFLVFSDLVCDRFIFYLEVTF